MQDLQSLQTDKFINYSNADNISTKGKNISNKEKHVLWPAKFEKREEIHLYNTVSNYVINGKFTEVNKNTDSKSITTIIYIIDSSGSMVKNKQIQFIKGLIESGIKKQPSLKFNYGAVALFDGSAKIISGVTSDGKLLIDKMQSIPSGGKTNMISGLELVYNIIKTNNNHDKNYHLYIFTDGRINQGKTTDPVNEAVDFYKTYLKSIHKTFVVDIENGYLKLYQANKFAKLLNAELLPISND